AISRELSRLLGGEIRLASTAGKGSTFTLYLPQTYAPQRPVRRLSSPDGEGALAAARVTWSGNGSPKVASLPTPEETVSLPLVNEAGDDRDLVQPGDALLLIVENDVTFARLLLEVAREHGFKGLVTSLGASALALFRDYKPSALTLDICRPDIDGW